MILAWHDILFHLDFIPQRNRSKMALGSTSFAHKLTWDRVNRLPPRHAYVFLTCMTCTLWRRQQTRLRDVTHVRPTYQKYVTEYVTHLLILWSTFLNVTSAIGFSYNLMEAGGKQMSDVCRGGVCIYKSKTHIVLLLLLLVVLPGEFCRLVVGFAFWHTIV